MNDTPEGKRLEQGAFRSAIVLGVLALGIPLGLHALFERQARRLEALADHGAPVTATVSGVGGDGSVHYAYAVDGTEYTWSVAPDAAPYAVGERFDAYYLPEDPALSRPGDDRSRAALEAASNRAGTRKGLLGVFWFFGVFALSSLVELLAIRRVGAAHYQSAAYLPERMRRRLAFVGAVLVPLLVAIFSWHAADAAARGESMVGVVGGIVLSVAVLGGTLIYALRDGAAHAGERAAKMASFVAPIAIGVAVLRLLALLFAP